MGMLLLVRSLFSLLKDIYPRSAPLNALEHLAMFPGYLFFPRSALLRVTMLRTGK
jgi:hypothetical protein